MLRHPCCPVSLPLGVPAVVVRVALITCWASGLSLSASWCPSFPAVMFSRYPGNSRVQILLVCVVPITAVAMRPLADGDNELVRRAMGRERMVILATTVDCW